MIGATPLFAGDVSVRSPGAILVAAGTPWETLVRDVRSFYRWAEPTSPCYKGGKRTIVYHHTASGLPTGRSTHRELDFMLNLARGSRWGLPYNFLVMPGGHHRIYYLNDVDECWPHTIGHNSSTAIAAVGNYSTHVPRPTMVKRMLRLADALASMWGEWVPELQHRDVDATECPGTNLAPLLPQNGRQRSK